MSFRNSEPVNFKHLMSMGYQQDWLNEHGKKAEEGKEEKKVWNGLLTGKTDRYAVVYTLLVK